MVSVDGHTGDQDNWYMPIRRSARTWFRWNGAKRWLMPRLAETFSHWPAAGRYVEPFVGGGGVSELVRRIRPKTSQRVSDANPWLAAAYERMVTPGRWRLDPRAADVAYWRGLTDADLPRLSLDERATRFLVCLLSSWGERWITDAAGAFTGPINKGRSHPSYLLTRVARAFSRPWLRAGEDWAGCADWRVAADCAKEGDLVYLDPPYLDTMGYGNQGWGFTDQVRLAGWARDARARGIWVVVSNVDALAQLYAGCGAACDLIPYPGKAQGAKPRTEVLATWRPA